MRTWVGRVVDGRESEFSGDRHGEGLAALVTVEFTTLCRGQGRGESPHSPAHLFFRSCSPRRFRAKVK